MNTYVWEESTISRFREYLIATERSSHTVRKYVLDVHTFWKWLRDRKAEADGFVRLTHNDVVTYKKWLQGRYAVSSMNSMLSAINCFLQYQGWTDCVVKLMRMQRAAFRSLDRDLTEEDYQRLLDAAIRTGNIRLYYIMVTLASTGIRISELPFITVESLETRRASVSMKGKTREVLLPQRLCIKLEVYARNRRITSGSIFVTRSGQPLDRSNVLHAMKALSAVSGVPEEKIYCHNLRHLFAQTYYRNERDIVHLADLLGHSNINTSRIYTMASREEQLACLDRMELVK